MLPIQNTLNQSNVSSILFLLESQVKNDIFRNLFYFVLA